MPVHIPVQYSDKPQVITVRVAGPVVMQCKNCGRQASKAEADQRKFNTGRCGFCGGDLEVVNDGR